MFISSHKVRGPVANILGIASLLDEFLSSPEKIKKMMDFIKKSATDLDDHTRELTAYIVSLERKAEGTNQNITEANYPNSQKGNDN